MRHHASASLGALIALMLSAGPAAAFETPLHGAAAAAGGDDVNRYVPDPVRQVAQLEQQGDYIGFHTASGHLDTSCFDGGIRCQEHWQGIARLPHRPGERNRFAVASSHHPEARLGIVTIDASTPGRLRGNMHAAGKRDWETAPPAGDRITASLRMDTALNHPGGMQTIGRYIAVGMERIASSMAGAVFLYDTAPATPRLAWRTGIQGEKVATASIVKLAPLPGEAAGRHLLVTLGSDSKQLTFNLSRAGVPLDSAGAFTAAADRITVAEGSVIPRAAGVPQWTDLYQTLQVVDDAAGRLFLLAANKTGSGGSDYIDVFALDLYAKAGTVNAEGNPSLRAQLVHVQRKHLYCIPSVSGSMGCDFSAAAGAYVDPDGRLYFYGTVHSDQAMNGSAGEWTRMMEFRPRDPLDKPGTATVEGCAQLSQAWVNLYDGALQTDGYGDAVAAALGTFPLDFDDRYERGDQFASFTTAYNFNDRAAAARYCIPVGYVLRLFEHDGLRGAWTDLVGDGRLKVERWADGARQRWSSACFADAAGRCGPPPPPANLPPQASITWISGPFGEPETIRFGSGASSDADGRIVSRLWEFGDGTTSTAADPVKAYAAFGTYPVKLTVVDDGGASASSVRHVTVADSAARLRNGIDTIVYGGALAPRYFIDVPADARNLVVRTRGHVGHDGAEGEVTLLLRRAAPATASAYDCRAATQGLDERCAVASPGGAKWFVQLEPGATGVEPRADVVLTATYEAGAAPVAFTDDEDRPLTSPLVQGRLQADGAAARVRVNVAIEDHDGELRLELIRPDGSIAPLMQGSWNHGDDQWFDVPVPGGRLDGAWTLRIHNVDPRDNGFLDRWTLQPVAQ